MGPTSFSSSAGGRLVSVPENDACTTGAGAWVGVVVGTSGSSEAHPASTSTHRIKTLDAPPRHREALTPPPLVRFAASPEPMASPVIAAGREECWFPPGRGRPPNRAATRFRPVSVKQPEVRRWQHL